MKYFWLIVGLCGILGGCKPEVKPKPKGFLALSFPPPHYRTLAHCQYAFKVNTITRAVQPFDERPCFLNIEYPQLKGTIYLTYEPVEGNLKELLEDAQKLPLKHTIKADEIIGDQYENVAHHTYGMLYTVTGDAASQAQFYLTDSTAHFLTGSVYFERRPDYDSLYPAAMYLKEDVKVMMESLEWEP